jgi:DNA-directed RNA polymerase subunit RPC12/RpoP
MWALLGDRSKQVENRQRTYPRWRILAIGRTVVVMANNLPTRVCSGCGQIWASGRFLDPTAEAACGYCGGTLVHRRRLPDGVAVELGRESAVEQFPLPSHAAVG